MLDSYTPKGEPIPNRDFRVGTVPRKLNYYINRESDRGEIPESKRK